MEFQNSPGERRGLDELHVGDIIYIFGDPGKAIIVEDDDLGDLNSGRVSKQTFINSFNAMSQEQRDYIRKYNPRLDLEKS